MAALRAAWRTSNYDEIVVTVAGDPYMKRASREPTSADRRLAMAHAAFDNEVGIRVDDRETHRAGPTHTIDTVRELARDGSTVELLLGADAANGLDEWYQAGELSELVTVGVFPRSDAVVALGARWRWHLIAMDSVDLSSTYLRDRIAQGMSIIELVPAAVVPLLSDIEG